VVKPSGALARFQLQEMDADRSRNRGTKDAVDIEDATDEELKDAIDVKDAIYLLRVILGKSRGIQNRYLLSIVRYYS